MDCQAEAFGREVDVGAFVACQQVHEREGLACERVGDGCRVLLPRAQQRRCSARAVVLARVLVRDLSGQIRVRVGPEELVGVAFVHELLVEQPLDGSTLRPRVPE